MRDHKRQKKYRIGTSEINYRGDGVGDLNPIALRSAKTLYSFGADLSAKGLSLFERDLSFSPPLETNT